VSDPQPELFRLAGHGRFLATREAGRRARELMERRLAILPNAVGLALDFDGVEAITGAFADEAASVVLAHGRRVSVQGANKDVQEAIDRAVRRRGAQLLDEVYAEWPGEPGSEAGGDPHPTAGRPG
jgi:hypothetical protein